MALEFSFETCMDMSEDELHAVIFRLAKESAPGVEVPKKEASIWRFWCDYYTFWHLVNKDLLDAATEITGMPVKHIFDFDLFLEDYEKSVEGMMRLIGGLMRLSNDDCYLLANGDYPIVMRRGGKTVVDDSRWVDREHFPYEALGIDFEWGVIPYD